MKQAIANWYPGDAVLSFCIITAVAVAMVSAAALVISRFLARNPATRHCVLLSALLASVAAPILAVGFTVSGMTAFGVPLVASVDAAVPFQSNQKDMPASSVTSDAPHRATDQPAAVDSGNTAGQPLAAVSDPFRSVATLVVLVWSLGSIVLAANLFLNVLRLRGIRASARPVPATEATTALEEARRFLHARIFPALLESRRAHAPMAWGFFRTVIMLPSDLVHMVSPSQLRDILVHELTHLERRDNLVVLLQAIARTAFWPIPFLHLLNRQLEVAREEVCDNYVLSCEDPVAYGETLLRVAQIACHASAPAGAIGMFQWRGKLEDRIFGLIHKGRSRMTQTSRFVAAGSLALFLSASAVLTCTTLVHGQRNERAIFLVQNPGLVYLDADGKEKEKLDPTATNGALSPDGRLLAHFEFDAKSGRSELVIRSMANRQDPVRVPLVFGEPAQSGGLPVWSADAAKVLIGEDGVGKDGVRGYAYRIYNLAAKTLTEVKLPVKCCVTAWSVDGKRFLADVRPSDTTVRVARLNADGTGEPEFLSPDGEFAFGARLAPGGGRVLYQGGPEPPNGERAMLRLYVTDLATKKRMAVDEPGETSGYCWSPDGKRIAYTWQRTLDKPAKVAERETLLITCDPDGRNKKTVTSRKYEVPEASEGRSETVYFFEVIGWH